MPSEEEYWEVLQAAVPVSAPQSTVRALARVWETEGGVCELPYRLGAGIARMGCHACPA